ncbi:MAG: MBL fold metallo-hydrolase, partial [Acidaminococcaceae bacterium]
DTVLLPLEKPCPEVVALLYNIKNKAKQKNMLQGQKIYLGKCIIEVLDAPGKITETVNGNEASAIVRLGYGSNRIVFTGDATGEAEVRTADKNVKAQVLKISHHGSPSSSELEFLQAVNPLVAIISVGSNNSFGHPAPEVLAKLEQLKIKTYRTDKLGAIKVVFDGSRYACYSYRYQKEYF